MSTFPKARSTARARPTRSIPTISCSSPIRYADLVIAYRNGSPVRIRDIGRAVSAGENELIAGWFNQKRAIILAIQRQPGANVIETVSRIKAMMPVLQASIPAAVKINVISDRTQTIRASVADVQFTLMLTVALVVMVIFIFLRNFWATIIPAVTVPLSLVGTFAMLYEMGYSLDNLSLMALSIAVGFVVDDAVVEIENITRHIEDGMSPYRRGAQGVRRDRLHRHGDHVFADRRVHSAVPDERLCRIAVPRVRDDGERGARSVAGHLADAHADDVRIPAQAGEQAARMALPDVRARLRWPALRL